MIMNLKITTTTVNILIFSSIGGILYGFDIGVVSGALPFIRSEFGTNAAQTSLLVAAVLGGGSIMTLLSGPIADWMGRRRCMTLSGLIFTVGIVIIVLSNGFALALLGRLVQGVAIGIITIVVPLYVTECAPKHIRGRAIALFQLCLTFGILLGYIVNLFFKSTSDWRGMFSVSIAPAAVFTLGCAFVLPQSPRWLYVNGRITDAKETLIRICYTASEARDTMCGLINQGATKRPPVGWSPFLRKGYRLPIFIAISVAILNQLTGDNVLLQFNATILSSSGIERAFVASTYVGITHFAMTAVALMLVDRIGRRPLLIIGTIGLVVALTTIGLAHSALAQSPDLKAYGTLAGFIIFQVFYAVGPGVVAWLAVSEILPTPIRARGMSIALFAGSAVSAGLASIFMSVVQIFGYDYVFFILAVFCVLYFLVATFLLPEAKGQSLEEVESKVLGAS